MRGEDEDRTGSSVANPIARSALHHSHLSIRHCGDPLAKPPGTGIPLAPLKRGNMKEWIDLTIVQAQELADGVLALSVDCQMRLQRSPIQSSCLAGQEGIPTLYRLQISVG
jgi:hypothetical protein